MSQSAQAGATGLPALKQQSHRDDLVPYPPRKKSFFPQSRVRQVDNTKPVTFAQKNPETCQTWFRILETAGWRLGSLQGLLVPWDSLGICG